MNYYADEAIEIVNKIIDNVRCSTCDKLEGTRVRYQCGHIACDDCVFYTQECQTCTSPPLRSHSQPKYDKPLTETVQKALNLLKACHSLFDANAFQRKRISEQLKIEKELFPECIQAPMKYENKRKSSIKAKENRHSTLFPGEEVSSVCNMSNKENYVEQWLSRTKTNIARKPISDLNVNSTWLSRPRSKNFKKNIDEHVSLTTHRKRTFKSMDKRKDTSYEIKKKAKRQSTSLISNNKSKNNFDNEESGIFMEHDDPIIIYDSQESVIDKDKIAWLAVLQAEQNKDLKSTSLINLSQANCTNDLNKQFTSLAPTEVKETNITKVPFFKRSAIIETCKHCKNEVNLNNSKAVKTQLNPVKITIDGDSFLTSISIYKNVDNNFITSKKKMMNTVSIQTDKCEETLINIEKSIETDKSNAIVDAHDDVQSGVLFTNEKNIFGDINHDAEVSKCIVIQESDSDTDLEVSGPISVKADFHRSCTEFDYRIFKEVSNVRKHESGLKHKPRRPSPTSTDSSEKENYNPNKMKKGITGKKKCASYKKYPHYV